MASVHQVATTLTQLQAFPQNLRCLQTPQQLMQEDRRRTSFEQDKL